MVHSGLPSIFPIRLHSGPLRGEGQQRGFLISSGSHFSSGGPSGWDGVWMIAPFCSIPLSLHFIPILAGSSWGTPSPVGGGRLAPCGLRNRSCSDWGHPASYSFTGDSTAFPGLFAFLVGGNRTLVRLMPNLRSPAAVHHRALCPYSPQSPPQLVGQSRALCPAYLHVQHTSQFSFIRNCLQFPIFLYFFFRVSLLRFLVLSSSSPSLSFSFPEPFRPIVCNYSLFIRTKLSVLFFFFVQEIVLFSLRVPGKSTGRNPGTRHQFLRNNPACCSSVLSPLWFWPKKKSTRSSSGELKEQPLFATL
ncbi:unnamed protein product [Acanthosepion pharaonis]|uniref:Uncharacterized protein n=1 Tax=Acanthosepion pharaonis TaxID=158019 RepID=A0A812CVE1_ACAPH|nr:unnamed protein product [Sepia pharaonis]